MFNVLIGTFVGAAAILAVRVVYKARSVRQPEPERPIFVSANSKEGRDFIARMEAEDRKQQG